MVPRQRRSRTRRTLWPSFAGSLTRRPSPRVLSKTDEVRPTSPLLTCGSWRWITTARENISTLRDWLLVGPLAIAHWIRHIAKFGPQPVLTSIVEMVGTYNQLNLPHVAPSKVLRRRLQALVEGNSVVGRHTEFPRNRIFSLGVVFPTDGTRRGTKEWTSSRAVSSASRNHFCDQLVHGQAHRGRESV